MDELYKRSLNTLKHLEILHNTFVNEDNYPVLDRIDYQNYVENMDKFSDVMKEGGFLDEIYGQHGRQMILADFVEYIFLGRMYLRLKNVEDKERFTRAVLHFVNLLMTYETITISDNLRKIYLNELGSKLPQLLDEDHFIELNNFMGKVGLTRNESDASQELDRYFDSILPKTAGGLWHELLVYIFLLRSDFGYIIPLLLSQRLVSKEDHIVPPDFLVIAKDKSLYGVEVGLKKEIQSGSFSLRARIPTATIDTINSRTSDRCPICKKWILFCPFVIMKYSNFNENVNDDEVRCLRDCDIFDQEQIIRGDCSHTKYSRKRIKAIHTHHDYANGLHYHYKCVLDKVSPEMRESIIMASDSVALKTHFPYYSGLEYINKS